MRRSFSLGFSGVALGIAALGFVACGGGGGGERPNVGGSGGLPNGGTAGAMGGTGLTGGTGAAATGGTAGSTGGTAGSGGTTAGAGGTGGVVDMCTTRRVVPGGPINSIEMLGVIDPLNNAEGRRFPGNDGGWFIYHANPVDSMCMTCMTTPPRDGAGMFALADTMPARSGSTKALNWVGTAFQPGAYGGGIGFYLDCAQLAPEVTGISFWYRSDIALVFGTSVDGADHTFALTPQTAWTNQTVSWDMFAPAGINRASLGSFFMRVVPPAATTVDWNFSVWLDDLAWVGGMAPPPMGGAGGMAGGAGTPGGGAGGQSGAGGMAGMGGS